MLPDKIAKPNPKYRARRQARVQEARKLMRFAHRPVHLLSPMVLRAVALLRANGVPVPVSVDRAD